MDLAHNFLQYINVNKCQCNFLQCVVSLIAYFRVIIIQCIEKIGLVTKCSFQTTNHCFSN